MVHCGGVKTVLDAGGGVLSSGVKAGSRRRTEGPNRMATRAMETARKRPKIDSRGCFEEVEGTVVR